METFFVNADSEADVNLDLTFLGEKVGVLTTAQHLHKVDGVVNYLESKGKKVFLGVNKKTGNKGEVLGCEFSAADSIKDKVDCFLYIGTGEFHPLGVFMGVGKRVVVANPVSGDMKEITAKDVEFIENKKKAGMVKFLSAKNVGVLVSLKKGQNRLDDAFKLKEKLNKNVYVLLCDTLDFGSLEDFNFIDCFVNTMCPRIGLDDSSKFKAVVNIDDIKKCDKHI